MEKRVHIIIPDWEQKHVAAVYTINFGFRFYIGSTYSLTSRRRQHEHAINLLWEGGTINPRTDDCYSNMLRHLRLHPEITVGEMFAIHKFPHLDCDHRETVEYIYLKMLRRQSDMCLNRGCFYHTEEEIRIHFPDVEL